MSVERAEEASGTTSRPLHTEIEAILQGFAAAGADRGLYYLSTAITTGRREFELLERLGCSSRSKLRERHAAAWRTEVVQPNERDALLYADMVAETVALGLLVVNPARITLGHWTQAEYDALWSRLIEDFPVTVVATPSWEYSRGARVEIQLAIDLGIEVVDIAGASLAPDTLVEIATRADDEVTARKWRYDGIELAPVVRRQLEPPTRVRPFEVRTEPDEAFARQVFVWLARERNYQLRKFGTKVDDEHTDEDGLADDGWWIRQLGTYLHRARILGLENVNGRQALAKYVATGCGLLESVVRLHGPLPVPGVPSGEIAEA